MKYLPFLDGKYSTAPGLNLMSKAGPQDQLVFQLDEQYAGFIGNKLDCRKEDIHKYYVENNLYRNTAIAVNKLIVNQLTKEHPSDFKLSVENDYTRENDGYAFENGSYTLHNKRTGKSLQWKDDWINVSAPINVGEGPYISLFDALCSQVQEDIAICQLDNEKDWLAAIHLSAPNHWSPAEKAGKPFGAVHSVVPGMEKLNQQYMKMLITAIQKGPFFRFAWGIATDLRLNHHPLPPPGVDPTYWQGRKPEAETDPLYLRVERQTITGLPGSNAFLFTIRTYFYDVDELEPHEKEALQAAVESMSPQSLEYKGLTNTIDILRNRLCG